MPPWYTVTDRDKNVAAMRQTGRGRVVQWPQGCETGTATGSAAAWYNGRKHDSHDVLYVLLDAKGFANGALRGI